MRPIILILPLLAACAPAAPRTCQPADVAGLAGRSIDSIALPRDLKVRVVPDGMMVTMDVQPDRMTIFLNKARWVVSASCG